MATVEAGVVVGIAIVAMVLLAAPSMLSASVSVDGSVMVRPGVAAWWLVARRLAGLTRDGGETAALHKQKKKHQHS